MVKADDEVAVYNRALTQEEIQQDMSGDISPAAISPSGKLVTRWAEIKGE